MTELTEKVVIGEVKAGLVIYSRWKMSKAVTIIGIEYSKAKAVNVTVYGLSIVLFNFALGLLWRRRPALVPGVEDNVVLMAVQGQKGFLVVRSQDLEYVACPFCKKQLRIDEKVREAGGDMIKMICDGCGSKYGAVPLSHYIARFYPEQSKKKVAKNAEAIKTSLRARASDLAGWLGENDPTEITKWFQMIDPEKAKLLMSILKERSEDANG